MQDSLTRKTKWLLLIVGVWMPLCGGCSQLPLLSFDQRDRLPKATKSNPALEVICLWEPAEGLGLDDMPTRGFAGQLLFFGGKNAEPLRVDGEVKVYVFDDVGTLEEQAKPIHEFVFEPDAWNQYLRVTNLGAAYQLFLPYTRKGSHQATCAIRVRYMPTDGGRPVYSKLASVILPGSGVAADNGGKARAGGVVTPASHETAVGLPDPKDELVAESIQITREVRQPQPIANSVTELRQRMHQAVNPVIAARYETVEAVVAGDDIQQAAETATTARTLRPAPAPSGK